MMLRLSNARISRQLARAMVATALVFPGVAGETHQSLSEEPRPLTDRRFPSRAPAWSPNGARIAFESERHGKWSIYVVEVSSGRIERLTNSGANDRYPAWSPDGTRIVLVSDRGGEPDLHMLDVSSRRVSRLLAAPGDELFPAWSPDGREIAFSRQLAAGAEICTLHIDGRRPAEIAQRVAVGLWPRWSPDGRRMAFFSRRDTGNRDDEIYVLDRQSGTTRRVTMREGHDFCPAWDPTGDMLVVASIEGDDSRSLRILSVTGEEHGRLARAYHRVTEPAWSPDGRFIVYAAVRAEGQQYQLFLEPVPPRSRSRR